MNYFSSTKDTKEKFSSSYLHAKKTVSYRIKNAHLSGDPQFNSSWKNRTHKITKWLVSVIGRFYITRSNNETKVTT